MIIGFALCNVLLAIGALVAIQDIRRLQRKTDSIFLVMDAIINVTPGLSYDEKKQLRSLLDRRP